MQGVVRDGSRGENEFYGRTYVRYLCLCLLISLPFVSTAGEAAATDSLATPSDQDLEITPAEVITPNAESIGRPVGQSRPQRRGMSSRDSR